MATSCLTDKVTVQDFVQKITTHIPNYVTYHATHQPSKTLLDHIKTLAALTYVDCSRLLELAYDGDGNVVETDALSLGSDHVTNMLHSLLLAIIVHKGVIQEMYSETA